MEKETVQKLQLLYFYYKSPEQPITQSPVRRDAFLARLSEAKKRESSFANEEQMVFIFEEGYYQYKNGEFVEVPIRFWKEK